MEKGRVYNLGHQEARGVCVSKNVNERLADFGQPLSAGGKVHPERRKVPRRGRNLLDPSPCVSSRMPVARSSCSVPPVAENCVLGGMLTFY